jgi:hypothetical protein
MSYEEKPMEDPNLWYYCEKGDAGPWGSSEAARQTALFHRKLLGRDHIIVRRPKP